MHEWFHPILHEWCNKSSIYKVDAKFMHLIYFYTCCFVTFLSSWMLSKLLWDLLANRIYTVPALLYLHPQPPPPTPTHASPPIPTSHRYIGYGHGGLHANLLYNTDLGVDGWDWWKYIPSYMGRWLQLEWRIMWLRGQNRHKATHGCLANFDRHHFVGDKTKHRYMAHINPLLLLSA